VFNPQTEFSMLSALYKHCYLHKRDAPHRCLDTASNLLSVGNYSKYKTEDKLKLDHFNVTNI